MGVSFILSAGSLYFSTGQFGIEMFKSYFANVYTIILNTAPILFVILILLIIVNRLWISVGIASILVIVLSLINYFKLSFRDDPLLVEDLSLFFEMRNMTERYKIHISSSMLMWIAGMVVITFILWKIRKNIKINTKIKTRIILGIILMLSAVGWVKYFILNDAYYQKTENIALINRWGSTQQFISRGFIYPFLYSSKDAGMKKPDGYNKKEIENSLKDIKEDDIPGDKKVNIIAIMMEAYGDFSVYPQIEFDSENDPYAAFNRIKEISYHGNLLTDIFAAGTVRTERRFITGADAYPSLRKNTYSYARYFTDQGYCVAGSHPCYSWFYNRINVNDHLGFSKYDFYESIIDEVCLYDNFNIKMKVYYFWENEQISDSKNVIIGFENFHTLNINIKNALISCKKDNIITAHIEIDSFELMRESDLIHIIIKNQYGDIMFDIICENIFIDV